MTNGFRPLGVYYGGVEGTTVLPSGKEGKTMYKGYWLATMRLKAKFAAGHRTVAFTASLGHGCFFQD
jgi:hypothetical protein